jgi:hypothetical protein
MRKNILVVLGVLVMMAVALNTASADPAIVIKNDGDCGMPGADENGDLIFGGIGIATTTVINDNKVMIKCMGAPITNLSGQGQNFSGFECGITIPDNGSVITTDTHATVSASGRGTMTCTLHLDADLNLNGEL